MRPNVSFPGNATEAIAYYQAALGGELEITRWAGTPAADHAPADWGDKILYGRLLTPFGEINVMDAPPGAADPAGGNIAIAIDVDDDDRAAQIFAKLADGGEVIMPFEETFFARKFGMTGDKFGVRWMVAVAPVGAVTA
jgi:PhnB protein